MNASIKKEDSFAPEIGAALIHIAEALGHLFLFFLILHGSAMIYPSEPQKNFVEGSELLFEYVWTPYSSMSVVTATLLLAEAYLFGRYRRLSVWIFALLPPLALGIISAIEMNLYPGTHNLWGITAVMHFLILFPLLFLPAAVGRWVKKRNNRIPPMGHCTKCAYNLTGNTTGTCPECGKTIHH